MSWPRTYSTSFQQDVDGYVVSVCVLLGAGSGELMSVDVEKEWSQDGPLQDTIFRRLNNLLPRKWSIFGTKLRLWTSSMIIRTMCLSGSSLSSLQARSWCQTVSYAAVRSINMAPPFFSASKPSSSFRVNRATWSTVDLPRRKPACSEPTIRASKGFILTVFWNNHKSYQDAQVFCRSKNSLLAEIKTAQLQTDIEALMGQYGAWVGGKYSPEHSQWEWSDGSAFNYTNWNSVQPNEDMSGNCIEVDAPQVWTKRPCQWKRRFVCQRDPCNPNACINGGTCSWIATAPYYKCACREVYQGKTCKSLKYPLIDENCKYHLNHYERTSAQYARRRCQNDRTSLAILTSKTARDAIMRQMKSIYGENPINFWIGAGKDGVNWKWNDGTIISSNTTEQSASGNCLTLKYSNSKTSLVPAQCASNASFICEKWGLKEKPCASQLCRSRGRCENVGCHYKCTCDVGYAGKDCEQDRMFVTIPRPQLYAFKGEKLNITIYIATVDFPVDITLCKSLQYQKEINGMQGRAFSGLVGPFDGPNSQITCSIRVAPKAGGYYREVSVKIIVLAPAKITSISPETIVIPFVSGVKGFTCSVAGLPTPDIKWYKGNELIRGWKKGISSTGGVAQSNSNPQFLNIAYARETDAGKYTCRVNNTVVIGTNTTEYTDAKSVILRVALKFIAAKIQPTREYVEEADVSCSCSSYPKTTISWKYIKDSKIYSIYPETGSIFNISSITNDSSVVTRVDSKLQIRLADCLGAVEIRCIANNTYATKWSSFKLNQQVKPLGPRRYIFSGKTMAGQEKAQNYCSNFDATLATIRDRKTQEFLTQNDKHFHPDYGTFIGGMAYDEGDSRLWKWPDGSVFYNETKHGSTNVDGVFVAWSDGNPVSDIEKRCTILMGNDDRRWANAVCTAQFYSICERTAQSTPVHQSTKAVDCSATITVSWKPAERAIGIKHRIVVKPESDVSAIKPTPIDIVPRDEMYHNEFRNLSYATKYDIKIYVCPDQCLTECHTEQQVTTGAGLPGKVRRVNAAQSVNSAVCTISWTEPISVFNISSYEITSESQFVHFFSEQMRNTTLNETNVHTALKQLRFNYSTSPNRNYTFSVQARTCAGLGSHVVADGRCTTKREAPPSIPKPEQSSIGDDGTLSIKLSAIDESNGPASCVIVVVITKLVSTSKNKSYRQEELQRVSTDGTKELSTEYITLAISRKALSDRMNSDGEIALRIGDDSTTWCDASQDSAISRRRRATSETTFRGRNIPLNKYKKIGIIIVVAIPVDDEKILYKSSQMTEYGSTTSMTEYGSTTSNVWIAGVVVGVIGFIVAVVIAIYVIKRRREGTKPLVLEDRTSVPMTALPNPDEPLYANLTNESTDLRSKTDIPLERLESVYSSMKANKNRGFEQEYQALKKEATAFVFSKEVASQPSLKKKNRYKNILPFDSTRVKLSGDGDESYINASYIEGYNQPNKFIATQGPLPSTVDDFWRMVVEQKCRIIVMLTKCFEKGKKKCEQYWPDLQDTKQYGKITVYNQQENTYGSFVKATLKISTNSGEETTVYHFHLLKWPDHGVPVTTSEFFRFQSAVCQCQRDFDGSMTSIVHCSAGAGRTGAFIAYDCISQESKSLKRVDIYNCVLNLRKQRVDMVQSCDQYILVHKLLLENFLFETTQITGSEAGAILRKPDVETRISEEFSNLSVLEPIHADLYGAHHDIMNRNKSIIPYERTKVIVSRMGHETDTPYINASFMETYNDSYALVAAQGPVEASVENFWRAAFDHNVTIIIALTKCIEGKKEQCAQYWPNEVGDSLQLQHISIEMKMQYLEGQIVVREMHVKKENELKKIVQYHYTEWPVSSCPSDPTVVLALVKKMQRQIHPRGNQTVLVHCSDGAGRTGAFCAIVNLLERLKSENVVDVFREVKDLRDCRPGMVQTPGQYRFCYQAIEAYIAASSVYSNFAVNNEEKIYENVQ